MGGEKEGKGGLIKMELDLNPMDLKSEFLKRVKPRKENNWNQLVEGIPKSKITFDVFTKKAQRAIKAAGSGCFVGWNNWDNREKRIVKVIWPPERKKE